MIRTSSAGTLLRQVSILSDLNDEELDAVIGISKRVEVSAGSVIMKEEELGDAMYFFISGEVDVSKALTLKLGKKFGSAEKSMVKLKAEYVSLFGEMAMFGDEPRSATITASSDCVLYEVRRENFLSLCRANPSLGLRVMIRIAAILSNRVRKGNEDVLKLTTALSIALSK